MALRKNWWLSRILIVFKGQKLSSRNTNCDRFTCIKKCTHQHKHEILMLRSSSSNVKMQLANVNMPFSWTVAYESSYFQRLPVLKTAFTTFKDWSSIMRTLSKVSRQKVETWEKCYTYKLARCSGTSTITQYSILTSNVMTMSVQHCTHAV